MIYTNADQLTNKRDELCMFVAHRKPDIILVTEVIAKAQVNPIAPALLAIHDYTLHTNFDLSQRNLGSSGVRGIAVYVHHSLHATEVSVGLADYREQLWLMMPLATPDRLLIGCLYRSPSGDGARSVEMLADILSHAVSAGYSHLVIAGDFNLPMVDWSLGLSSAHVTHYSHAFVNAVQDCLLHQHITQPTRFRVGEEPHTLDLIFSNEEGMVQNIKFHPGLGKSDHVVISFELECYTQRTEPSVNTLNLHKADFNQLNMLIRSADWEEHVPKLVQERYDYWKSTVDKLTNRCVPPARPKAAKRNIYINREALKMQKKKRSLWLKYMHSKDIIDHARFVRCRNDLRRLTRDLRSNFEKRLIKDVKENPKSFWRYVQSRMKTRSGVEDLIQADGTLATENDDKARVLNAFFSSVFTVEKDDLPTTQLRYSGPVLDIPVVTPGLVEAKLKILNSSKSPGPDGIHPRVLLETAQSIAAPLAQLYCESLQAAELPLDWKSSEIVPIFKKGSKQSPSNYRPVSLTAIPCKVLESIVRDHIMEHMVTTRQLHNAQHGFRPKRSCATQLLATLDDWTRAIERGQSVDAIYLDFSKAFDTVPHQRLLLKLKAHGAGERLLRWIESFLVGRRQRVVLNGARSSWTCVRSGVPQGSVLGPLLFVIYVNDLPEAVQSNIQMFADDTKIYRPLSSPSDAEQLQADLNAAIDWSSKWQLHFNAEKCRVMHIGRAGGSQTYSMGDSKLEQTTVERDLGIQVDRELKFRAHAASAVTKASQVLAVIRRSFELLDVETLPVLFKTLVRPHLEYCNTVWGPFNRADQQRVERIQRRATKMIPAIRDLPYAERLRILGLPSLYYRRRRGDMIAVYQLLHGGVDLDPELFITPAATGPTRGHPWKLMKLRAETRTRRFAFGVRIVSDWNALPGSVVASRTLNAFKAKLDAHWSHLQYTIHPND